MKLAYNILIAILLLTVSATDALAKAKEYTKTIKKEFEIATDGTTSISNKYGKVIFRTWDKNRVKIASTIIVEASNESQAQSVFNRINIEFSNTYNLVKAVTNIEPEKGSWWKWGGYSKSEYSINYDVYLPRSNNIEVYNKYGDVYSSMIDGNATIDVKYGNFRLEGIGGDAILILGYGNGDISTASELTIDTKYSKLQVEEASNMEISSKYSKMKIDRVETIRCNSKYDTYDIGKVNVFKNTGKYDNIRLEQVGVLDVISKYTHIQANKVNTVIDLNMEYGDATIDELQHGFKAVNLNGKYTDFKIYVDDDASYYLDAYGSYAGTKYPSNFNVTLEREKGSDHEVQGYVGTKDAAIIRARMNYGGLKVKVE